MKQTLRNTKGITLIALVITIIILLILSGITISSLTNTGLFKNAKEAKNRTEDTQRQEQDLLNQYEEELNKYTNSNSNSRWDGKVNKPELMTGMSAIKFIDPTDSTEGSVVDTKSNDTEWYNYEDKKWANAKTEDGSMWVWIPRYAYRIHKENGVETQKFDIVFLNGLTDTYYDENGKLQTAQRQTSEDQTIVTNGDTYTVHPAFTNESSINYANGGWDAELAGIWVAKFEAGYASGNNSATVKASSVNYSQDTAILPGVETNTNEDSIQAARNWLDGEYGSTTTAIKYPTFQGLTYSMDYINHNDSFRISKALTENGNIYGLSNKSTDSHLMKNSEWGAVAYLSQSKYGLDGTNILINDITLNNSTKSIYAVTGCAASTSDSNGNITTIDALNNRTQSGVYVWTQKNGVGASSTGTIYGIYDLSGGLWERTASILNNGNEEAAVNGSLVLKSLNNGKSSKYVTVYPHDPTKDNTSISNTEIENAIIANYNKNIKIYGDAIRETSTYGIGQTGWYIDYSYFIGLNQPFLVRGSYYYGSSGAGLFSMGRTNDNNTYCDGFRSVLVSL